VRTKSCQNLFKKSERCPIGTTSQVTPPWTTAVVIGTETTAPPVPADAGVAVITAVVDPMSPSKRETATISLRIIDDARFIEDALP